MFTGGEHGSGSNPLSFSPCLAGIYLHSSERDLREGKLIDAAGGIPKSESDRLTQEQRQMDYARETVQKELRIGVVRGLEIAGCRR